MAKKAQSDDPRAFYRKADCWVLQAILIGGREVGALAAVIRPYLMPSAGGVCSAGHGRLARILHYGKNDPASGERQVRRLIAKMVGLSLLEELPGTTERNKRYRFRLRDNVDLPEAFGDLPLFKPDMDVRVDRTRASGDGPATPDINNRVDRTSGAPTPDIGVQHDRTSSKVALYTEKQNPKSEEDISTPREGEDRFVEFWNLWLRKEGEVAARRAWDRDIAAGTSPETLIRGAMRYAAAVSGKEPQFIALASNWIKDGRYDAETPARIDDPPEAKRRHAGRLSPDDVDAAVMGGF